MGTLSERGDLGIKSSLFQLPLHDGGKVVHMEQVQHQGAEHLLQRGVGEEDVETGEGAVHLVLLSGGGRDDGG